MKAFVIAALCANAWCLSAGDLCYASMADSETRRSVKDSRSIDWQQDIDDMTARIEKNANDFEAYCERADAFSHIGQYQTAFPDFDKALKLKPDYGKAYFLRANAYRFLGDANSAIEDYSSAIKLDPNCANAYRYRAACYKRLGVHADWKADTEMWHKLERTGATKHTGTN